MERVMHAQSGNVTKTTGISLVLWQKDRLHR
jgi:hypothetical protein